MLIKLQDLRIHYKIFAPERGEAYRDNIVLLHGWGAQIDHYSIIEKNLAQKNRVFAIDLPGFGLSASPSEPWGVEDYATLVTDFINNLGITDPILLGHSFGGKIAIYLAANDLVKVKKLILVGSAGIKEKRKFSRMCRVYCYKLLKYVATRTPLKIVLGTYLERYQNRVGSSDYRNAKGIMRRILVKLVNEDLRNLLPKLKEPTLLVWGERDTETTLKSGRLMQQLIPNAQLVVFSGAGHFPFVDDSTKFNTVVNDFLNS